jgi:uncharacterized protein (DUF362 family)
VKRRRFLGTCLRAAGASLLLPGSRLLASKPGPGPSSNGAPDIVLARGDARAATHAALEALGGMERFVKPGQVVAVKPNASFARPPEWGVTTHPEVLAAVLESCFAAGARRVLVLDHTMDKPERCFERNGTAAAVGEFKAAKLVSLDDAKFYRKVEVPGALVLHETDIPLAVQKADVFINVPTAKSHSATDVSLGIKNLMGLVWDRHTFHQDLDLHAAIADLATVLRPDLCILDAMHILKTGGPVGPGAVDDFGGVIAGTDSVAVDAFGVGLAPWNGRTLRATQVAYLRHAAEHGLGSLELESLHIEELS